MLPLTLFVQQTDQTLFCQPQVNQRRFSVDDVIQLESSVESSVNDIAEEMYIIFYEPFKSIKMRGVPPIPIFSCYNTNFTDSYIKHEPKIYAKSPTKAGWNQFLKLIT
jgi:hypothetical protein